jgi:hypothetical protein
MQHGVLCGHRERYAIRTLECLLADHLRMRQWCFRQAPMGGPSGQSFEQLKPLCESLPNLPGVQ